MAKLIHIVLLLALVCGPVAVVRAADDDDTTTTSTTTTTTEQTTTTESTSTTTESTSTTTSTTEKTTTTTESTSTTTSTTTAAPPAPVPVPDPVSNHWVVKNDTRFCLMVDMAVQVNLTYQTSEDGSMLKSTLYDIPQNAKMAKGECGPNMSRMFVETSDNATVELDFALNETSKQYKMKMIMRVMVAENQFPGAVAQNLTVVLEYADSVPQGKSYHCNRQQTLNGTLLINGDEEIKYPAALNMSKAQWQAFHDRQTDAYDLAKDCDSIDTPDIVPIAVGCALAGLVVIVLLGYLVGRRRAQGRGQYLSM